MAEVLTSKRDVTTMQLVIDWATLASTGQGTISAGIWLEAETTGFPERRWSDLAVAVTRAFAEATDKVAAAGAGASEQVYFLDGPFSVLLSLTNGGTLVLRGLRREQDFGWEGSVDLAEWREHLRAVSRQLLDESAAKGWRNADLLALESWLR
jgi:hypothetical protein